jgi:hypothetical protein
MVLKWGDYRKEAFLGKTGRIISLDFSNNSYSYKRRVLTAQDS